MAVDPETIFGAHVCTPRVATDVVDAAAIDCHSWLGRRRRGGRQAKEESTGSKIAVQGGGDPGGEAALVRIHMRMARI